ncbi:ABC transporter ATP-binding protein [Rhodobacteraceae bacterium LMO-12]|nr:ABC transporter ATP-binding protein [Rhodobacteraceae bacterium LMO-JJ12]
MLKIEKLTVAYGGTTAVKDINLKVDEGCITVLIGANGAGKSSVANCLTGLVPARSGRILLRGQDIARLAAPKRVAKGMVLVPEGRGVFAELSVLENLELGAYLRSRWGVSAEVEADLDRVVRLFPRLKERFHQAAGSLSGGEQQMLVIGRALMAQPKLLVLDEPSLGLAPLIIEEIADVLRQLCDEMGLTILVSEQNAVLGLDISDFGYVLHSGSIVMSGPTSVLRDSSDLMGAYLGQAV